MNNKTEDNAEFEKEDVEVVLHKANITIGELIDYIVEITLKKVEKKIDKPSLLKRLWRWIVR